ncbi:hypothetical protein F4805DRAFT_458618 [Annulohypoxylon moriforme]|nr:hypothetical protein F4805DRAFT_458618 [Annulohypoxylon moriforme]
MSATATPEEPRPDRTTFGVELEFLVPWLLEEEDDPLGEVDGLAPLFRVKITDFATGPGRVVRQTLAKLFQDHGLNTISVRTYQYKTDYAKRALHDFSKWTFKGDGSLREHDRSTAWFKKYQWVDVEIGSPVEPTTPIAYEILNYARQLLTSTYRCRVNDSCGLHVHVGKGFEPFDLVNMRRISALVWSSEHLFVNLNHPSRQSNFQTPTLRTRTVMAVEKYRDRHAEKRSEYELEACLDYLAREVRHGERLISFRAENSNEEIWKAFVKTREDGHYEPFQWKSPGGQSSEAFVPIDSNEKSIDEEIMDRAEKMAAELDFRYPTEIDQPCRIRTMPRMENVKQEVKWDRRFLESDEEVGEDPGVFEGVRQLFDCPSSCDIASLMYPRARGYVNFNLYDGDNIDRLDRHGTKRTIEFRGAEGTLDSWVVTWAKICVGIVRFALYSPSDEFLRVLMKCDSSNKEVEKFDCIDFLDEIGLPAEAALAEKHLKENEVEFGIQYVDESSEEK